MVHEPHDALFKATFSNLQNAAEELRAVLPPALAVALDWSTLALESGSFVAAALEKRYSDLLFSVSVRGDPTRKVLLYLLFEHQSEPRWRMAFHLLRYEVDVWTDYLKQHPHARRLPAVIPLVLYHGERAWTAPRNLIDLIDLEGPTRAAVERYLPAFEYLLDDLSTTPDQALKQRSMNAASRLVLGALKRGRQGDWRGFLLDWPEVMEEVLGGPDGLHQVARVLLYLMSVDKASSQEIEDFLKENAMSESVQKAFVSTADILMQRGYDKGYDEGRDKGYDEGHGKGQADKSREMLRRQLARRFGPLPDEVAAEVTARIEQAEPVQLDRWLEEVVVASSLEQVFRA